MNQDDEQTFDYSGYDLQGYDVQAYEEQPYAEQGFEPYTEPTYETGPDAAPYAAEAAMKEARVPQAPPSPPMPERDEETPVYQDDEYDDDQEYLEEDEDEDFPEPATKAKPPKAKGKSSPVTLIVAAVGALGLAGAFVFLDPLGLGLSESVTAMLPFGGQAEEAAPPPEDSQEWQAPAKKEPARTVHKPKPVERKPAAEPRVAAKPKPKPVAAKPKHTAPRPKPAAPVTAPAFTTALAFAPNSAWVAAAEVEKLWAFSSRIKGGGGHVTVEGYAGYEADPVGLSRRRAEYVADMLRKNNAGLDLTVTVKAMGRVPGSGPRVNVKYSRKL